MTTLNEWCNLCRCSAYKPFTHVHGKRHCKRLKQFNETFRRLNTSLKFKIVSFLFPRIVNFYTLHKEIHSVNMHRCINEMICFKFNVVTLCDTCCFPKETLSYDEFQHIYSTVPLCLNCAYTVLTTSTYLNDRLLYVHCDRVMECSCQEMYDFIHEYYRFGRIADMMRSFKHFQNRNNTNTIVFDLTSIQYFWYLDDFIHDLYCNFNNKLHVLELYKQQQQQVFT